jgi:hypothetical protein
MTESPGWSSPEIDYTMPSVARVYDYYLGGSHNFESDRAFGEQALRAMPQLPTVLRDNRAFLRRVVRHLSAIGIDQFLDLGSGIPTVGNVHQVAQQSNPRARIVYVDHDPVAVAHSHALLSANAGATVISADIRNPQQVLMDATATGLLDLRRPVAVLLIAVLHFVPDSDDPAGIVAGYANGVAAGSHVAISHARADGQAALRDAAAVYDQDRSPTPMRLRSGKEVEALFGDLTMVPPGVVLLPRWNPEPDEESAAGVSEDYPGLAGLGRRD